MTPSGADLPPRPSNSARPCWFSSERDSPPDTLLGWHRKLIAAKYNGAGKRGKRGPEAKKANSIRKLVLEMCKENPSWGYGRIYGELKKLGYKVHWQTVRRVMLDHGILPDPDRPYKTSWKTFIKSHWECIAAADFFTGATC